jgi:hypothetical protein
MRRLLAADLDLVRDKLLRFVGVWLAGPRHCVRRFGRP